MLQPSAHLWTLNTAPAPPWSWLESAGHSWIPACLYPLCNPCIATLPKWQARPKLQMMAAYSNNLLLELLQYTPEERSSLRARKQTLKEK